MSALVRMVKGHAVTSSRMVAEAFDKQHKNVLRAIDSLVEQQPDLLRLNFKPMFDTIEVGKGAQREVRYYEMTRDGFSLLAMGFTGAKALEWKIQFIEAFNAMEQALSAPPEAMYMVDTPEAIEKTKVALYTIREARCIFGRGAAADLWTKFGFPLPENRAVPRGWEPHQRHLFAVDANVARWRDDRLLRDDCERIESSKLYHDYVKWCEPQRIEPVSHSLFGKCLTAMGVDVKYSNGAWRLGVKLAA